RENDLVIRWGGEEFLLIVKVSTDTQLQTALAHLRQEIKQYDFPKTGHITCSFGATTKIDTHDIKKSIKRADNALYKAKNSGRNRVVID
ncbi:MAG: GGDEF domain-containing protein, partial [Campylobacterota bacterium]